jgi:hypothetical protein
MIAYIFFAPACTLCAPHKKKGDTKLAPHYFFGTRATHQNISKIRCVVPPLMGGGRTLRQAQDKFEPRQRTAGFRLTPQPAACGFEVRTSEFPNLLKLLQATNHQH